MTDKPVRLLLIDDNAEYRQEAVIWLSESFTVDEATDGRAALDMVTRNQGRYDVALIDQNLGSEPDGITVLSRIRQDYPDIEGIVLTGYAVEDRERAVAAGAFGYVSKDTVTEKELLQLISNAPEQARLRRLSRDIFSRLESEEAVCRRILNATAAHLRADSAALTLYDPTDGRWRAYYLDAPADDARAPLSNRRLVEAIRAGGRPIWQARLDETQDDRLVALGLASLAAAPITGQDGFLGALIIYSRQPNHFNSDRPAGLQTLATWAGPALDNTRAYLKIKDQAGDLQTLQILAREIASSLDTETVGNQTCAAAVKFFDATHSGLLQFGENDAYGVVTAEFPPGRGALGDHVPLRDVPDEQMLIQERQPLRIVSVAQRSTLGPVRPLLLGHGIRATLIVPVVAADRRLLGSFSIDFDKERPFSEEDETYALMFASWAAIALDHARVFRESEAMARQLDSLERAARQLRETDDPQTLHHQIVRGAVDVMGCAAGCLILNHPDQRALELIAHVGLTPPPELLHWSYGLSLVGQAAREGRVVRCSTYDDTLEVDPPLRDYGFGAAVIAPLLIMDEVRALLLLLGRQPRLCDSAHENILSRYVDQAAGTLRASQAMTTGQRSIDQLRLLHRINVEIRDAADLRDTLHMVLTAITANYGWKLNCAALWLLDEGDPAGPALVGHTGIGHFSRAEAQADYETMQRQARATFAHYQCELKAGQFRDARAPFDQAIRGRRVPLSGYDWLRERMAKPEVFVLAQEEADHLPPALREAYRPGFPLLLAPLVVHDRAVGLLTADNRIIGAPMSAELRKGVGGLADAAAVAISNDRLSLARERVWRASTAVAEKVVQEELEPTLKAIADSLAAAVGAAAVTVYAYDAATERFTHRGFHIEHQRVPDSVCRPQDVPRGSLLYQIVDLMHPPYRLLHDETRSNPLLMSGKFVHSEGIRAAVALQLRSRGECIGVLLVDYRTAHIFDEHELESIQSFAHQAAAAIYGQKQYRAATYGNQQLKALHHAALSIGDTRGLDKTLTQIARQALAVVGATNQHAACHVALLHGNTLQFRAASSPETLQRLREEVGVIRLDKPTRPSIIARVARNGRSENLADARVDRDYWPFEPLTKSQLAVVIKRRETVIGVINLEHPDLAHFTAEDEEAMERLAALAAVSIQSAEDREQREIVARISREVNTCRNLDDFLQAIYKELDAIFQRHEIAIRLALGHHEPEAARLAMRRIPWPPNKGRPFIALSDDGIIPRVAAERRARYVANVNEITNPREYYALWPDTIAEFAVPVEYEGELLAVLDVQSTASDAFTVEDQNLVSTLAAQLATTMHNLNQNDELENTQRKLRKRATLINHSLITTRWSHDIRQVTRNIVDSLDVMELDLAEAGIEEAIYRGHRDKIAALANQIRVKQPIKTPTDRRQGIRRLAANDLVRRVTADLCADWRDSEIRRHIRVVETYAAPDSDSIAVDEGEIRWIIETILDNAGRYLRGRVDARIDISTRRGSDEIEMCFADNGPGIDPDRLPLLFEQPTKKGPEELGEGIGLYIAGALIEEYGGRIVAANRQPHGALFRLSFPLATNAPADADAEEKY